MKKIFYLLLFLILIPFKVNAKNTIYDISSVASNGPTFSKGANNSWTTIMSFSDSTTSNFSVHFYENLHGDKVYFNISLDDLDDDVITSASQSGDTVLSWYYEKFTMSMNVSLLDANGGPSAPCHGTHNGLNTISYECPIDNTRFYNHINFNYNYIKRSVYNNSRIRLTLYDKITVFTEEHSDNSDILNNQDQNSQDEINNANKNQEQQNQNFNDLNDNINNQFNECRDSYNLFNKNNAIVTNGFLGLGSKDYVNDNASRVVLFKVEPNTDYVISRGSHGRFFRVSGFTSSPKFGDIATSVVSADGGSSVHYKTPSNVNYIAISYWYAEDTISSQEVLNTIQIEKGTTLHSYEAYGEKVCTNRINETNNKIDETNQQLGNLNNNITNSDTTEANGSAESFFSGFESNDYGLSSIITAPLNLIKSITSSTCTPIGFKAPFVNQNVTLPCMGAIYKQHFGTFLNIYQTITFGIVAYWVSINIFAMVKGFKDPDSDRIEVLDL